MGGFAPSESSGLGQFKNQNICDIIRDIGILKYRYERMIIHQKPQYDSVYSTCSSTTAGSQLIRDS